jgi:putative glutamine amidotransferase
MRAGVTYRREEKVERYEKALREVGIEPVRIAPGVTPAVDSLDGLVLTGGADINPACYGQAPASETQDPDDARDELELQVLKRALSAGLPVLAICRGMQLFNVAHGGTLIQHLPTAPAHAKLHAVRVAPDTRLASIIGPGEHEVNSRHHQAVDEPGKGLLVSAVSSDGVIEALERPGEHFAVAVQWHPEDLADRKLFEAFATSVGQGHALSK